MTIAERLRNEKRGQVGFSPITFLEMVEEFFENHKYDSFLTIKSDDCYKQYPKLCVGTIHKSFSANSPEISYIGVPPEYLKDAISILKAEGFYIYIDNVKEYKITLTDAPFLSWGCNTWYNITDKILAYEDKN